jgi:hypothetical protein
LPRILRCVPASRRWSSQKTSEEVQPSRSARLGVLSNLELQARPH